MTALARPADNLLVDVRTRGHTCELLRRPPRLDNCSVGTKAKRSGLACQRDGASKRALWPSQTERQHDGTCLESLLGWGRIQGKNERSTFQGVCFSALSTRFFPKLVTKEPAPFLSLFSFCLFLFNKLAKSLRKTCPRSAAS